MSALKLVLLSAFALSARAGAVVWSGNFDYYNTVADFDKWSWANQVGEYQWYIHGNKSTSSYLALDKSYKNPAASESKGLKLTIDPSSTWNSNFLRTELIPQTKNNLGTGQMYYHFSLKSSTVNTPNPNAEHQIVFFESHFTELKLGVGSTPSNLVWMVTGNQKWSTKFTPGTWYNFAYDINFSAGTVGLWASTGSNQLVKVVQNVPATTYTNSADWHVGVLRLTGGVTEDWYFSNVYVESGAINVHIDNGGGTTTDFPWTPLPTGTSTSLPATTTAPNNTPTPSPQ